MSKEPGGPREEEKLIDFSSLTDEELKKRLEQEEANESESEVTGESHGEKNHPGGTILRSLQTEALRRKEQGER